MCLLMNDRLGRGAFSLPRHLLAWPKLELTIAKAFRSRFAHTSYMYAVMIAMRHGRGEAAGIPDAFALKGHPLRLKLESKPQVGPY